MVCHLFLVQGSLSFGQSICCNCYNRRSSALLARDILSAFAVAWFICRAPAFGYPSKSVISDINRENIHSFSIGHPRIVCSFSEGINLVSDNWNQTPHLQVLTAISGFEYLLLPFSSHITPLRPLCNHNFLYFSAYWTNKNETIPSPTCFSSDSTSKYLRPWHHSQYSYR